MQYMYVHYYCVVCVTTVVVSMLVCLFVIFCVLHIIENKGALQGMDFFRVRFIIAPVHVKLLKTCYRNDETCVIMNCSMKSVFS